MEIRPMYKNQLAELLNVSKKQMMLWINGSELLDRLNQYGYNAEFRILTLKQVELILDDLGEEVSENGKVPVRSYSKKELCQLYGISKVLLMKMIYRIPNKLEMKIIMNGNFNKIIYVKKSKNFFTKEQVQLIFKWLGHPYMQDAEVLN